MCNREPGRQIPRHRRHDLALEADEAVRHEDDLALGAGAERPEGLRDPRSHLRPAAGLEAVEPAPRLPPRGSRRGRGARPPPARPVGERDQLQPVRVAEALDQRRHHGPGLGERRPAHRAARVEEHDQVPREGARRLTGRRRHQGEEPVGDIATRPAGRRAARVQREADGRGRDRPADHEIPVERRSFRIGQPDLEPVVPPSRANRVRGRLGDAVRAHRIPDQEAQRHADGQRRLGDVDRDPRRVGHAALGAQVPRRDDGREPPLPRARVEPPEALVDGELRDDLGARRDVPELLGEEARAVLLEQRRRPPLEDRLLEALARGRAPVHLADDPALADPECEARDRAVDGERQEVGDVERVRVGVPEALLQHHPGEAATGLGTQGGALEGKRAAVGCDELAPGWRGGRTWSGLDPGSLTHGRASFRLTRPTHGPASW